MCCEWSAQYRLLLTDCEIIRANENNNNTQNEDLGSETDIYNATCEGNNAKILRERVESLTQDVSDLATEVKTYGIFLKVMFFSKRHLSRFVI